MWTLIKRVGKNRKWLLSTLLLISLACTLAFYIRSVAFLDWIGEHVEKEIQEQITSEYIVHLGKIQGNILRGVHIEGIRVVTAEEQSDVISTGEIVLKYNLLALLRRKFVVTALEVSEPWIHAVVSENGTFNLTQIFRPRSPETDSQFRFAVKQVHCQGGVIRFAMIKQNLEIAIEGVSLELKGPLNEWHHTGKFAIKTGSLRIGRSSHVTQTKLPGELTTTIERFKADFLLSTSGNQLKELFLKFGNSALKIRGESNPKMWSSEITLLLDLKQHQHLITHVLRQTEVKSLLQGMAVVRLSVQETDATLGGTLRINMSPVTLRHPKREETVNITDVDVDADFALHPVPRLTLSTFRIRGAGGSLAGKARLTVQPAVQAAENSDENPETELLARLQRLAKRPIIYEGEWHATKIHLESLFPILPEWIRDIFDVDTTSANLLTSGAFSGSYPGFNKRAPDIKNRHPVKTLRLHSKFQLTNTVLNDVPVANSTFNCTIEDLKGAGAVVDVIGNLDAETGLSLKGPLVPTPGKPLQLQLTSIDMSKVMRVFNSADLGGKAVLTANISHDKTTTGSIEIPDATFMNIPLGVLGGGFRYRTGQVFIENGFLNKGESRLSIVGTVDVAGELPANFRVVGAPSVQVADYKLLLFGTDYPIEGVVTGELHLDGSLTHLNGRGNFHVNAGEAWGIHLDALTLPLEIENYGIRIPDFKISARGEEVIFNFDMQPDGSFELAIKNREGVPIRLTEIAKAADISDFPIGAKMDVDFVGTQRVNEALDFRVGLNFSDITFENNPLGDAYLLGRLVEDGNRATLLSPAGDEDKKGGFFRFDGYGFGAASQIQGEISTEGDSPYHFVVVSEAMPVSPILRIFNQELQAVTGTADSTVHIRGNLTELSPDASGSKQVFPYNLDITVEPTLLHYQGVAFENEKPIHLELVDDVWTIKAFALTAEKAPFIEVAGTFLAGSGAIDVRAASTGLALDAIGKMFPTHPSPISGIAQYTLTASGTMAQPILKGNWAIPHLSIKTEIGDVVISDAEGRIEYQKNYVIIEPFTLQVLGNEIEIEGDIAVNPEEFTSSYLNVTSRAATLDLAKFETLVRNALPPKTVELLVGEKKSEMAGKRYSSLMAETENRTPPVDSPDLIAGMLDVLIGLSGSLAKPVITVHAASVQDALIRVGVFAKPIRLENLHMELTPTLKFIQVRNLDADWYIGNGAYHAKGEASFATDALNDMRFAMDVSAENMEIRDFTALVWDREELGGWEPNSSLTSTKIDPVHLEPTSPIHGTLSGDVRLVRKGRGGVGLPPTQVQLLDDISMGAEVYQLNLSAYSMHILNRSPFKVSSVKEGFTGHIPLRLVSDEVDIEVDVKFGGTLVSPEIVTTWHGTLGHVDSVGEVEYQNEQLNLVNIELTSQDTHKAHKLMLSGIIPLNGRFDRNIDVHLRGHELPLIFFPGLDAFLSEVEGVVDIDVVLRGTTRSQYLEGSVSVEAPRLWPRNFPEPLQNTKLQLKAQKNLIDVTKFQFELADANCTLEQSQLILDGLIPQRFEIAGLKVEDLNLVKIFPQFSEPLSHNAFITDGKLTTILKEFVLPLDGFFANPVGSLDRQVSLGEMMPVPKIREMPTLVRAAEVSTGLLEIEHARLVFVLPYANQPYDFRSKEPIPIRFKRGVISLDEGFHFENFYTEPGGTEAGPFPNGIGDGEEKVFFSHGRDRKPNPASRTPDEEPLLSDGKGNFVRTVFSGDVGSRWELKGDLDTTVRLKNFDVSALTRRWPPEYRVKGTLSGSLHVDGTAANPRITVRRNKPANRKEKDGIELNGIPVELNGRLRYQTGEWKISTRRPFQVTLGENQLTCVLTVPLELSKIAERFGLDRAVDETDLTRDSLVGSTNFVGEIDVAVRNPNMLSFVVPGFRSAKGSGTTHITFFGTLNSPKLSGIARFNDFAVQLPEAGLSLKNTTGHLELLETRVDIKQVEGVLNGGDFALTGSLISPDEQRIWQFPNQATIDVSSELKTTAVFEQQGQYQVVLDSATFHLHGKLSQPTLTGDVNVRSGYYQQNWEDVTDWLTASSEVTEVELALDYPVLRDLVLQFGVNISDSFHVLSSVVGPTDVEIACFGRLIGPVQQPIFTGNVSFLRGTVGLFARTFEIVSGSDIRNQSTDTFNPDLNLSLSTAEPLHGVPLRDGSTVDLLVKLAYTGKLDNPNLNISAEALSASTTYLPTDEEILALLTQRFSISRAFGGITFTFLPFSHGVKGRNISAEYPLPLGRNMSIRVERDEEGEYGVDFQLEGRF